MDLEIDKIFDEIFGEELELERIERDAIKIDLSHLYSKSDVWNTNILWKIFDLLIQSLFPNSLVERIVLPMDTPPDILRDVVNKLKNCRNIVVIREYYDTLYYCVQ